MSKFYHRIKLNFLLELVDYVTQDVERNYPNLNVKYQEKIIHKLPIELTDKINSEFKAMGFPNMWYMQSYIRAKGNVQGIHVDGYNNIVHSAINIPISGTEGTRHVYYSGDYELKQVVTETIQYHAIVWKSPPLEEDVLELDTTYLLRVDAPHSAEANKNKDRWISTIRMQGNPMYEDLVEKYEKYIQSNIG